MRLSQPQGLTLPYVSNYREVDVQLRETLTIKYMKEVQRLLTGRLVSEKEEEIESNAERVRAWIVQWREDRKTVRPGKRKAARELEN